jgi:hypothetical protein
MLTPDRRYRLSQRLRHSATRPRIRASIALDRHVVSVLFQAGDDRRSSAMR